MNSEQIEITVGVSLILRDIINEILYARKTTSDGREYVVDRELPFRLRYRLNKNRIVFEKDAKEFQDRRLLALAKYGEATPDGKNVVINDPQKQELFKQEISDIIDSPVIHSIVKLEPEDIELVSDTDINIAPDAMALFIGYMTNDPELQKDLETKINIRLRPHKTEETPSEAPAVEEPKTEETKVEETKVEEVKEEDPVKKTPTRRKDIIEDKPVLEGLTEEPKTEDAPKKTSTKKSTTTKKTTTTKKAESTADSVEEVKTEETPKKKTTTTKKTTTKKVETPETTKESPKKTTTRKPRTKKVTEETVNG